MSPKHPDEGRNVPHLAGPEPLPGNPARAAEDLMGELESEAALHETTQETGSKRSMTFWWVVLFVLVLHTEAVAFSFNLVSPVLVPLSAQFKTTQLGWMYTALTLVGAVSIPIVTKLADAVGKKQMILVVTAIASAGALLCAVGQSYGVVLVGRGLEGFLLALVPLTYSLMRDIFPKRALAFAVTITASGVGIVTISGPFIAGYLVDHHGWRSVFWFLFALQVIGLFAIAVVVPASKIRHKVKIDWAGGVLLGVAVGLMLLGVSQGATWQWTNIRTLACILGGAALLGLWVGLEHRVSEPLIDLHVIKSRSVLIILAFGMMGQVALAGAATVLPILVQTPRELGKSYGFGVSAIGLTQFTVPAGVATVLFGFALGAIIRRSGAKVPVIVGLVVQALGCLGLAFIHGTKAGVIGSYLLLGVSQALVFSSIPALVIASVPARLQAVSAGVSGTTQSLGGSIGPAICFAILTAHVATLVQGQPIFSNHGMTITFAAMALVSAITLVIALAVPRLAVPGESGAAAPRVPAAV